MILVLLYHIRLGLGGAPAIYIDNMQNIIKHFRAVECLSYDISCFGTTFADPPGYLFIAKMTVLCLLNAAILLLMATP